MLARVADSLYWMARYLERAEFTARLVGLQIQRLPVGTAVEVAAGWRLLFAGIGNDPPESESLGNMEDDDFLFVDGYTLTDILTFEQGNPAAVANCLAAARENAREVRSAIGPGIWSSLNREYLALRRTRLVEVWKREPELLYRDVAEGIQRFHGICDSSMRRGTEWSFMQLGRYVERAQLVCSMLVAHCNDAAGREHGGEWPVLLRACNAFEAYGRECGGVFEESAVLGLLLHEGDLPYSLRFCLERLRENLDVIGPVPSDGLGTGPLEILSRLEEHSGDGAQRAGDRLLAAGDLRHLGELFRTFHDALEGSYAFRASDG
ncbi:MAG: alpha-E domain-containing protein [Gammaproteobacteria bacterium]|nr:alpha-E domain-containing protein [Gammaproteobacteria bacterium]